MEAERRMEAERGKDLRNGVGEGKSYKVGDAERGMEV
jgi:hypothetical protein